MFKVFSAFKIGPLELPNRFIKSPAYESMAERDGSINDDIIKYYEKLACGEIGLIIAGYAYVHPSGRAAPKQIGLHSDEMIPGLKRLTGGVHNKGAKIAIQIMHAGKQTVQKLINMTPLSPSDSFNNLPYSLTSRAMKSEEILTIISAFGDAALRAREAGFDAVQIHGAHGYLVNQFLSPLANRRDDEWGGSIENRMRFLKEVASIIRKKVGRDYPVFIKLNVNDYVKGGFNIEDAIKVCSSLSGFGLDAVEISVGTVGKSILNMSRGDFPSGFIGDDSKTRVRILTKILNSTYGRRFKFKEAYIRSFAKKIKPLIDIPLILVGGIRRLELAEDIIISGDADFISMCRPFIREPHIVKRWRTGNNTPSTCANCNRCLGEISRGKPLRCYFKNR